jgi:hypothetical protein
MLKPITFDDVKRNTKLTKLQFQNRFTFEELIAIEEASVSDAGVRVLQKQQSIAEFINLEDPITIAGVNYLVSKELITQERANSILAY